MKHKIFLFDGLGAAINAFFTGCLLPLYQPELGIPSILLTILFAYACGCAFYSLVCFDVLADNWRPFLLAIIAANLLYACFSLLLVFCFLEKGSGVTSLYFMLEFLLLCPLLLIEWRLYSHKI
jgi:hypothetical protein